MLYMLKKLFMRPDISFFLKGGRVVRHHGKNSDKHIDDIEAVCRIHNVTSGMLFGKWAEDHYKITATGKLKSVIVPLKNCIN